MAEGDFEARSAGMFARDAASQSLGIRVEMPEPGRARASLVVTDDMLNGFGVCHGGFIFTLADTAFAFACNGGDEVTVAAGATIEFLESAHGGDELTAVAIERSRRGRTGIYDVTVTNQSGIEIAIFRGRSHATRRRHEELD